jgi:hypothetical protein
MLFHKVFKTFYERIPQAMDIDKTQLKYKFSKAKHGAANAIVKHPVMFIGAFCTVMIGTSITESVLKADLDQQTTEQTAVVQQQLQQQFGLLAEAPEDQDRQRSYLENLFQAEDLSEKQTYDMMREFEKTYTHTERVLDYDIGNIGDLRESRAEVGTDDMQQLADYNNDKSTDEKIVGGVYDFVIFPLWILLCMNGLSGFRAAARNKPKNPIYKH